jgi:hypothetical protein
MDFLPVMARLCQPNRGRGSRAAALLNSRWSPLRVEELMRPTKQEQEIMLRIAQSQHRSATPRASQRRRQRIVTILMVAGAILAAIGIAGLFALIANLIGG